MAANIYIIYLGYSELYYIPIYLWLLRIKCYLLERELLSIYMAIANIFGFWLLGCKELYYYYILGDKKLHWPLGEVVFGEGGPKDQTMGIWCFNIKFQIHAKIF